MNISIREFARRMGVTDGAVRKAIRVGKIASGVIYDEKGRLLINLEVATAEWSKNFNPNYERNDNLHKNLTAASASKDGQIQPPTLTGRSLIEIKKMQAEVRLQLDAIELRKAKGELVDKKKVYAQLFTMGQEMRATFQAIPDRVIDSILAAKDRNEAHNILSLAISEALLQLSEIQKRDIA